MPIHATPTPPPTFASAEDPPSKMKKTKQALVPTLLPPLTRTALVRRLKLERQRSYAVDHAHDDDDDRQEDDGWERGGPPSLSSSPSSTSLTIETRSPVSPVGVDDEDVVVHRHHDDLPHDDRRWISSAACDEEVKEWGQYLDEGGENRRRRRLSGATAASSSTGWSAIAVSCGDCVY